MVGMSNEFVNLVSRGFITEEEEEEEKDGDDDDNNDNNNKEEYVQDPRT